MNASSLVALPTLEEIRAERARRKAEAERDRLIKHQGAIRAKCDSLHGFIEEHWSVLEPKRPFETGWALQAMCRPLEAVTAGQIQFLLMTVPLLTDFFMLEWPPPELLAASLVAAAAAILAVLALGRIHARRYPLDRSGATPGAE